VNLPTLILTDTAHKSLDRRPTVLDSEPGFPGRRRRLYIMEDTKGHRFGAPSSENSGRGGTRDDRAERAFIHSGPFEASQVLAGLVSCDLCSTWACSTTLLHSALALVQAVVDG
jgi:hypothetical protein